MPFFSFKKSTLIVLIVSAATLFTPFEIAMAQAWVQSYDSEKSTILSLAASTVGSASLT